MLDYKQPHYLRDNLIYTISIQQQKKSKRDYICYSFKLSVAVAASIVMVFLLPIKQQGIEINKNPVTNYINDNLSYFLDSVSETTSYIKILNREKDDF